MIRPVLLMLLPSVAAATPLQASLSDADIADLRAEDRVNSVLEGVPWRYGVAVADDLGTDDVGTWTVHPDGSRTWTVDLQSPGARHLKLLLDALDLPAGAVLTLQSDLDHVEYTDRTGPLGTRPVRGDALTVTLYNPAGVDGDLHIEQVIHGYRDFMPVESGVVGASGFCNVNAACDAADDWRTPIESVVLIDLGNSLCTGTLVNNTEQDQRPLFLTASHCLQNRDVRQFSFWFNYESEGCDNPSSEPVSDIVYGSTLLADYPPVDMGLVVANEEIPDDFGAFFAGWDATGRTPDFAATIHHPAGDIKKFTYDADSPFLQNGYWNVGAWDLGTTEGGSSGSGLFDERGRVIGHLLGGQASCQNTQSGDSYGAVSAGWDGGGTPTTRLSDHLDPAGIEPGAWDGYGVGGLEVEAGIELISPAANGTSCGDTATVRITSRGQDRLNRVNFTVTVDGQTFEETWRGGLQFGESEDYVFDIGVERGEHELSVEIVEANGELDPIESNNSAQASFSVISATGDPLPFEQTFDDAITLQTRQDPLAGATWELVDLPERGLVAAMDNLTDENIGHIDALVLGTFDVRGGKPLVQFDYAHAQYGPEYEDGLRVVAINACDGVEQVLWEAYGADLATAPIIEEPFFPSEDEWATIKVDMRELKGETVTLEIQNVGAWGQWMYVDNVEVRKKKGVLGCRCNAAGSPLSALWLAPLLLLLRRRR